VRRAPLEQQQLEPAAGGSAGVETGRDHAGVVADKNMIIISKLRHI